MNEENEIPQKSSEKVYSTDDNSEETKSIIFKCKECGEQLKLTNYEFQNQLFYFPSF